VPEHMEQAPKSVAIMDEVPRPLVQAHELWAGSTEPVAITSRQYRELLDAYERLEEESRRRTTALATAAHELKTPLSIMSGYIELLLSDKLGPVSDRQRQILEDMRSNGVRLRQFIGDFLAYSALETGNVSMRFDVTDLNACLSEVCSFWMQRFHDKGVALYHLASDKLKSFPLDNYKVQHIVSNLLDNALKATARGGTVWLTAEPHHWDRRTAKPVSVASERRRSNSSAPNAVRITVSDTGVGIPAEYQQEIFEDFFKVPKPKPDRDGMGLGLAIARRLVQGHGGKMWMESQPGSGSKFSFLLPLNPL
jgi:signal transduction histidine kinase